MMYFHLLHLFYYLLNLTTSILCVNLLLASYIVLLVIRCSSYMPQQAVCILPGLSTCLPPYTNVAPSFIPTSQYSNSLSRWALWFCGPWSVERSSGSPIFIFLISSTLEGKGGEIETRFVLIRLNNAVVVSSAPIDTIKLHYGKCRGQCFSSLTHTRDYNLGYADLILSIVFFICLIIPQLYGSTPLMCNMYFIILEEGTHHSTDELIVNGLLHK